MIPGHGSASQQAGFVLLDQRQLISCLLLSASMLKGTQQVQTVKAERVLGWTLRLQPSAEFLLHLWLPHCLAVQLLRAALLPASPVSWLLQVQNELAVEKSSDQGLMLLKQSLADRR